MIRYHVLPACTVLKGWDVRLCSVNLFMSCHSYRSVINHFLVEAFSSMTADHTARCTTMPSVALSATAVKSQSLAGASLLCTVNSIQSTLCVPFAWSNWTKAHSRNRTTSPTATRALSSSLAREENLKNLYYVGTTQASRMQWASSVLSFVKGLWLMWIL